MPASERIRETRLSPVWHRVVGVVVIRGEQITRTVARQLATAAGLEVRDHVTKGLDLLVVADPDSQSGKAKRARVLGTRVMAEAVFWRSIGVAAQ